MSCRVAKEVGWGPAGLEPAEGARIRKKIKLLPPYFQRQSKIRRGWGIWASRANHGIVPENLEGK